MKKQHVLLSLVLVCFSCNSSKTGPRLLPDSSGRINTVTVVMPQNDWNGPLGTQVKSVLQEEYEGLPLVEPKFTVTYLPPKLFNGFVKHSRNILMFVKDSTSGTQIYQDLFAKPQVVSEIKGEDAEVQAFYFKENARLITATIVENERNEKRRRMRKSPAKTKTLNAAFGVELLYPTAYKEFKKDSNFIWIQKEIPKGHLNVIAYTLPLQKKAGITSKSILKIRDSIGRLYIPGRLPNTHMSTEETYRPYYYKTQLAERPALLTKGMWSVSNDYMAGPFVNYLLKDSINNRWMAIEGFAFAPSVNKREYMFELETIIRSIQFKN